MRPRLRTAVRMQACLWEAFRCVRGSLLAARSRYAGGGCRSLVDNTGAYITFLNECAQQSLGDSTGYTFELLPPVGPSRASRS